MNAFSRFAVILILSGVAVSPNISAHQADCPVCELGVVQDTEKMDNEVALKYGKKRIEYRCVMCAIADAEHSYKGDLLIVAPTEKKGRRVTIERKDGVWTAPDGLVFAGHKVKHRYCQSGYRALTSAAAFPDYVRANAPLLDGAEPVRLDQMLAIARAQYDGERP